MTNYLVEKLQTFISTVKRKRRRVKFQQKLALYPDWDREEQIQKNQGAIKTMQDWLNQEVSDAEKVARDRHYRIFIRTISRG